MKCLRSCLKLCVQHQINAATRAQYLVKIIIDELQNFLKYSRLGPARELREPGRRRSGGQWQFLEFAGGSLNRGRGVTLSVHCSGMKWHPSRIHIFTNTGLPQWVSAVTVSLPWASVSRWHLFSVFSEFLRYEIEMEPVYPTVITHSSRHHVGILGIINVLKLL